MKKKILIVDDNNHLVLFLEKKLAEAGHEIVTAFNGLSAIKALADYTPDIIFCDYFLPNINGDKLCQIIRRMEHLRDTYIVIMSAAAAELNLHPDRIGANAFIAKASFQETEKHMVSIIANLDDHLPSPEENRIIGLESVFPRQMTKELIAQNSYLQTMLDNISEGIIETHAGQVVYVNSQAMNILGKPEDQILAVPFSGLFEGTARTTVEKLPVSESGGHLLIEHVNAAGQQERILSIKRLPANGHPDAMTFLMEDVTERIHAEKSLRDSHHHLEELVQERTADLKRAHEMLQQVQKLEAMGTLAGGIAHDFNNILGGMIGYMELAKMEPLPDKRQLYLDQALQISNRAKDMIRQILIFSRHQEVEKKPLLAAPLISEGLKMLKAVLPSTIRITHRISGQSAMILADGTQIHQILMNLCTNAAHAMRERGGELDIQFSEQLVSPGSQPDPLDLTPGTYAKLIVKDTGQGIDPSIIGRIFDPFFTTKKPGEGTGLGLSVVYGIVRDHGGRIDVASLPGQGTTISVFLPIIETGSPEKQAMPEPVATGHERILLVDDESIITEVVDSMLTFLGYQVTARQNSLETLELFRSNPDAFDLVITDMTMPRLRGDELARELLKIRADIPIILCTGYSEIISEEKAQNIGIRQFIMKPIYMRDMAQAIRKALD